jgi:hypothetical protein
VAYSAITNVGIWFVGSYSLEFRMTWLCEFQGGRINTKSNFKSRKTSRWDWGITLQLHVMLLSQVNYVLGILRLFDDSIFEKRTF